MSNPRLMGLTILPPWEEIPESHGGGLAAELQCEVGPGHPLFGTPVHVLAHRVDCDDILVEAPGLPRP